MRFNDNKFEVANKVRNYLDMMGIKLTHCNSDYNYIDTRYQINDVIEIVVESYKAYERDDDGFEWRWDESNIAFRDLSVGSTIDCSVTFTDFVVKFNKYNR